MRITSKQIIAGQPAIVIRDLLSTNRCVSAQFVAGQLRVGRLEAEQVIEKLVKEGYLEADESIATESYWRTTVKGNRLANASAAPPIKRSTADRAVSELLCRIEEISRRAEFLYEVSELRVFGSYLQPDRDTLNDLDLVYTLIPKENERQRHNELCKQRQAMLAKDKRFRTYADWVGSPYFEVAIFLERGARARRSRFLSFHRQDDPVLNEVDFKVIYRKTN